MIVFDVSVDSIVIISGNVAVLTSIMGFHFAVDVYQRRRTLALGKSMSPLYHLFYSLFSALFLLRGISVDPVWVNAAFSSSSFSEPNE